MSGIIMVTFLPTCAFTPLAFCEKFDEIDQAKYICSFSSLSCENVGMSTKRRQKCKNSIVILYPEQFPLLVLIVNRNCRGFSQILPHLHIFNIPKPGGKKFLQDMESGLLVFCEKSDRTRTYHINKRRDLSINAIANSTENSNFKA